MYSFWPNPPSLLNADVTYEWTLIGLVQNGEGLVTSRRARLPSSSRMRHASVEMSASKKERRSVMRGRRVALFGVIHGFFGFSLVFLLDAQTRRMENERANSDVAYDATSQRFHGCLGVGRVHISRKIRMGSVQACVHFPEDMYLLYCLLPTRLCWRKRKQSMKLVSHNLLPALQTTAGGKRGGLIVAQPSPLHLSFRVVDHTISRHFTCHLLHSSLARLPRCVRANYEVRSDDMRI